MTKNITVKEFKAALESVGASYEEWLEEARAQAKSNDLPATFTAQTARSAVILGFNWSCSRLGSHYWGLIASKLRGKEESARRRLTWRLELGYKEAALSPVAPLDVKS